MKTCYYEVLGITKDADADVIKKAYRSLALRWHPDKNRDNLEEATKCFQLITEANEVLSDPHERAWYDSHKDQILRGEEPGAADTSSVSDALWKYFSSSSYKNTYDDTPGAFYRVYKDLFLDLANKEDDDLPEFGNSKSDWEYVQMFYSHWSSFSTTRGFENFDKWNLRDGETRQVRRAMEAENKKARGAAKKEFSETVRKLIDFVKKRDPRVSNFREQKLLADQAAKEKLEISKKQQAEEKQRQRELAREDELRRWEEIDRMKQQNDDLEISDGKKSSEIVECVVCDKTFKSEKSFASHENSKKHREAVNALRKEFGLHDAAPAKVAVQLPQKPPVDAAAQAEVPVQLPPQLESSSDESPVLKTEKNKFKREQAKEVFASVAKEKKPRRRKEKEPGNLKSDTKCLVCAEVFASKSALFKHLAESGHAAPK